MNKRIVLVLSADRYNEMMAIEFDWVDDIIFYFKSNDRNQTLIIGEGLISANLD